jgi:hypothetical protein
MDDLTDVQRLLRLKRYEAPAPEYFEDFLIEFQTRQRAEMLKRPLWRLALDRLEGALPTLPAFQLSQAAYAGSCALALVVAGVASERILTSPPAGAALHADAGKGRYAAMTAMAPTNSKIDFYSSKPAFRLSELDFNQPRPTAAAYTTATAASPRYVLDSQPVSYGQPYSF